MGNPLNKNSEKVTENETHTFTPAEKHAIRLAKKQLKVFALKPKAKIPIEMGYQDSATSDVPTIREMAEKYENCNFGLLTGRANNLIVLDIDGPEGRESLKAMNKKYGRLPQTVRVDTSRGFHLYFYLRKTPVRNSVSQLGLQIDVRGDGGYVVTAGSLHSSGHRYRYEKGYGIDDVTIADAPSWLLGLLTRRPDELSPSASKPLVNVLIPKKLAKYVHSVVEREMGYLPRALPGQRNEMLNRVAFKLGQIDHYLHEGVEAIKGRLHHQSLDIGLSASETKATIKSGWNAGKNSPRTIQVKSSQILSLPFEGYRDPKKNLSEELANLGDTDADNAQRFLRRNGDRVIYTPGQRWLVFNGQYWEPDTLNKHQKLADDTIRMIGDEEEYVSGTSDKNAKREFANRSKSSGGRSRMLEMVKPLLTMPDSIFNQDINLLNVNNGTIDLKTGIIHPHDHRDYITKMVPIIFQPQSTCPLFRKMLRNAVGDDLKLMRFVQRAIGYCLTGSIAEQVFFFLHGPGNTSKSTFINLMSKIVGPYAKNTPPETLMVKKFDNGATNDLARLHGSRFVTAVEMNPGRELDEAKIKAVTGGDAITARFLYAEFFDFYPEFKLWIVSNVYPRVSQTSAAFWRRPLVVPFHVKTPASQRDKDLSKKLAQELPGILAWAVRGAMRWHEKGLEPPKAVRKATLEWRHALDHVERFVASSCISDSDSTEMASMMFDRYVQWCAKNGEIPLSVAKFKSRMIGLNFRHARTKRGSIWKGISLKPVKW